MAITISKSLFIDHSGLKVLINAELKAVAAPAVAAAAAAAEVGASSRGESPVCPAAERYTLVTFVHWAGFDPCIN